MSKKNDVAQAGQPARGRAHYLLGVLLLLYLLCAWRVAPMLWMLMDIEIIAPWAGLLMMSGTAFLALGIARSLYKARLEPAMLLLAAVLLGATMTQVGNWDYKVSQGLLATLAFGTAIALLGAVLGWRRAA